MKTIIPYTVVDCPKMDSEMTYLKNKGINKSIRQKIRQKDVFETDMHKIYNIIGVQANEKLQEKA